VWVHGCAGAVDTTGRCLQQAPSSTVTDSLMQQNTNNCCAGRCWARSWCTPLLPVVVPADGDGRKMEATMRPVSLQAEINSRQVTWMCRNQQPSGHMDVQEPAAARVTWMYRNQQPSGHMDVQEPTAARSHGCAGTNSRQVTWMYRNQQPPGHMDVQEPTAAEVTLVHIQPHSFTLPPKLP